MSSCITAESLGQAYFQALKAIIERKLPHWYIKVHCTQPIIDDSMVTAMDYRNLDEVRNMVNVDEDVFEAFCDFVFDGHDGWSGDSSGRGWIRGRILDLLDENEGYYWESLTRSFGLDQLKEVERRLLARDKHGRKMHGGSLNGLVCEVYLPHDDLKKACQHRPRMNNARCLTQIDFKPIGDRLNLMATFRSQYFDTKAYGNLISLAILLYNMCQKTGYRPGGLVSEAHKVVFANPKHKRPLYEHLARNLQDKIPSMQNTARGR